MASTLILTLLNGCMGPAPADLTADQIPGEYNVPEGSAPQYGLQAKFASGNWGTRIAVGQGAAQLVAYFPTTSNRAQVYFDASTGQVDVYYGTPGQPLSAFPVSFNESRFVPIYDSISNSANYSDIIDELRALVQVGVSQVTAISNGCQMDTTNYVRMTFDRNNWLKTSQEVWISFTDIASNGGAEPLVSCTNILSQFANELTNGINTAQNQPFQVLIANGVISAASLPNLRTIVADSYIEAAKFVEIPAPISESDLGSAPEAQGSAANALVVSMSDKANEMAAE